MKDIESARRVPEWRTQYTLETKKTAHRILTEKFREKGWLGSRYDNNKVNLKQFRCEGATGSI
jgi:hypothetical protein